MVLFVVALLVLLCVLSMCVVPMVRSMVSKMMASFTSCVSHVYALLPLQDEACQTSFNSDDEGEDYEDDLGEIFTVL